jgi:hypothetical protein
VDLVPSIVSKFVVLTILTSAAPAVGDGDSATTAPIRLPVLGVGTRVYSTFDAAHVGDHDGGLATNTYVSAGATVAVRSAACR